MMNNTLRFLTNNEHKLQEFRQLLEKSRFTIEMNQVQIEEIQTEDMRALVEDKAVRAFSKVRRPLFVDHTGLQLKLLRGFPGGLTQIFWDRLGADGLAELIGKSKDPAVIAVTYLGYCDGKVVRTFSGQVCGKIAPEPRGPQNFQWDCVFIPDGHSETFAEMGDRKNEISMRRNAVKRFLEYLAN